MINIMSTIKIPPCGSAVPGTNRGQEAAPATAAPDAMVTCRSAIPGANRGREAAPAGNHGVPGRI